MNWDSWACSATLVKQKVEFAGVLKEKRRLLSAALLQRAPWFCSCCGFSYCSTVEQELSWSSHDAENHFKTLDHLCSRDIKERLAQQGDSN